MSLRIAEVSLGLLLCLLVLAPLGAGEDLEQIKAKIQKTSDLLVRATIEGDDDVIRAHYVDDALIMPSYHPMIRGKEAFIAHHKKQRESGFELKSMDFKTVEVWTAEDLIFEVGTYGVSFVVPETPTPMADHGKYLTVWRIQKDGSLKVQAEMWNTDVDVWQMMGTGGAPAPAVEAARKGKCPHPAQHCLEMMAKKLGQKGMIGLDGDMEAGGYRVKSFVAGTTAREAGVRLGDLLTKVNGIPLSDEAAHQADAARRRPGQQATITVLRAGEEHTMTVTLMAVSEQAVAEEIGKHMLTAHLN